MAGLWKKLLGPIGGLMVAGSVLVAQQGPPPAVAPPPGGAAPKTPQATVTAPVRPVASSPQPPRRYFPPLSLVECLDQIREVQSYFPTDSLPATNATETGRLISRRIESIYNYLEFRDDLHTSLADYQWIHLGEEKVQNDENDSDFDSFVFSPPVTRISALSLSVLYGDVHLHSVRVFDEKDTVRQEWDMTEKPLLLRSLLPRREVFHLWTRTTVSRVEIRYSRTGRLESGEFPRVSVWGGITERAEYIKTAMRHLQEGELALRQTMAQQGPGQPFDPTAWQTAHYHLRKADEEIRSYLSRQDHEDD